ncbi:MAG: hypothetical protein WC299_01090 [Kiritimatiellia bacterium]
MRLILEKFACFLAIAAVSAVGFAQESSPDAAVRLANGVPLEGTFSSADPDGLTIQTSKGNMVLPWKYLSAGTRWRYERPMLAELEAKRIKAEKAAKAKAEAEAKAAAAKAAKAAAAAAGSNAPPAAPAPAPAKAPKAAAPAPASATPSVTMPAITMPAVK